MFRKSKPGYTQNGVREVFFNKTQFSIKNNYKIIYSNIIIWWPFFVTVHADWHVAPWKSNDDDAGLAFTGPLDVPDLTQHDLGHALD